MYYKIKRSLPAIILVACLGGCYQSSYAQSSADVKDGDSTLYWKKAVEAKPDDISLHEKYIQASGLKDFELVPIYKTWMSKFPKASSVPLAIGTVYYRKEKPEAKPYLLKSIAINPKQANVYQMLAIDASRWGNETAARDYMGKAAETEPDDPSYAFYYAMDFEEVDPALWRTKLYELAKRFPAHERGAQGLYWLATRTTDSEEKLRVYELLRSSYAPEKFNWSSSGMGSLYDIYLKQDPKKALQMAKDLSGLQGWKGRDTLAQSVMDVRALLSDNKATEAFLVAQKIKLPRYSGSGNMIALLKSEVLDAAGETKGAYDSLVVLYAKQPSDELMGGIEKYARKLGKTDAQTIANIQVIRDAASRPAPPFTLGLYTSKDSASLEDFKGKVVLLTFWFPGCGPCRGEFPHFESVLKKFKGKEVVYLGINVAPEQDDYVLPFMKGTNYTFIPLRSTNEWAEKVYKVRGQPTNFLIDKEGKIVFSNFRTDSNNQRELELMISSLLTKS